jgi:predicted PhzF superfamily epimerase YddE/YHI9
VGRNEADWLVEVATVEEVVDLDPDLGRIAEICERGVMVTAAAAVGSHDFVSRFFAPAVGVAEDPVTGSAHCCLAPYWAERLGVESLVGYQASNRGGTVRARLAGDRVILAGQAVTVMRGELAVPWPQEG